MRYLVTGGAGFIGSHLSEELLRRGHEVWVLDDLSTGSIDNINHLKTNPNFHYTIDSVFNDPLVAEMVDRADVIVPGEAPLCVLLAKNGINRVDDVPIVDALGATIKMAESMVDLRRSSGLAPSSTSPPPARLK
mgnify:CR=1 FL=1